MQQPSTAPKLFCFVLMPFDKEFDDVYQIGIKEACDNAGAFCQRVDEQIYTEQILDRIYNQISKADVVIGDMTGKNPNVFYEVGYAHALGKPTILLTKHADDIPFDLKHFPHIIYGESLVLLREQLQKKVEWFVSNPIKKFSESLIRIEIYCGDVSLSSGNASVVREKASESPHARLTIFNCDMHVYEAGNYQIGIISSHLFACSDSGGSGYRTGTHMPDGKYLHMFKNVPKIFPQQYSTISFELYRDNSPILNSTDDVIIRLYTNVGCRDFPLKFISGKAKV